MICCHKVVITITFTIAFVIAYCHGLSFTTNTSFSPVRRRSNVGKTQQIILRRKPLTMRDRSSAYWFKVGDSVRVVEDVQKAGTNLRGSVGTVIKTWEKCDVDPTCCCAENVDEGMNVHVEFPPINGEIEGFVYYFAESELLQVDIDDESTANTTNKPFDGLSCTAFKLQQLQGGEQAQRIAAFEASKAAKENGSTNE